MKRRTDNERLLADVLSSEPDSEFSANVLAETLRGVRRQRRTHQIRRYGAAMATVITVALISSHFLRPGAKPRLTDLPQPTPYLLVTTKPLASDRIVDTGSLPPGQHVVSTPTVDLIQTVPGGFSEIGDDELISSAAPNVVALVRRGPHEAELVFISSPTDEPFGQQN